MPMPEWNIAVADDAKQRTGTRQPARHSSVLGGIGRFGALLRAVRRKKRSPCLFQRGRVGKSAPKPPMPPARGSDVRLRVPDFFAWRHPRRRVTPASAYFMKDPASLRSALLIGGVPCRAPVTDKNPWSGRGDRGG